MSKGSTSSRRQRRQDFRNAKMLRIKNMFRLFSPQRTAWHSKMAEDGKAAHEAHVNRVNDAMSDNLQAKLNSMKEVWASTGYNENEVKMLEEAWSITIIKDKDNYRADKKEARKLMQAAKESLTKRITSAGN